MRGCLEGLESSTVLDHLWQSEPPRYQKEGYTLYTIRGSKSSTWTVYEGDMDMAKGRTRTDWGLTEQLVGVARAARVNMNGHMKLHGQCQHSTSCASKQISRFSKCMHALEQLFGMLVVSAVIQTPIRTDDNVAMSISDARKRRSFVGVESALGKSDSNARTIQTIKIMPVGR